MKISVRHLDRDAILSRLMLVPTGFVKRLLEERQSFYSLANQFVTLLAGVIFLRITTHALSAEEYGKWTLFLSYVGVIGLAALPGNAKASVRGFVQNNPGNYPYLLRWGALFSLLGTLAAGILAVINHTDSQLSVFYIVFAVCVIPYSLFAQFSAWFVGRRDFRGLLVSMIVLLTAHVP